MICKDCDLTTTRYSEIVVKLCPLHAAAEEMRDELSLARAVLIFAEQNTHNEQVKLSLRVREGRIREVLEKANDTGEKPHA